MKQQHDTMMEIAKAAPSVSVAGLSVFGMPLSDAILVMTALYTVFLLIDKLPIVITRIKEFYHWLRRKDNETC